MGKEVLFAAVSLAFTCVLLLLRRLFVSDLGSKKQTAGDWLMKLDKHSG
jgi:hypothetical protein